MNTTRRIIAALMTLTVLSAVGVGLAKFDFVGPALYVLLFAFFLSAGTGIIFGLIPALQTTRHELISTLKSLL